MLKKLTAEDVAVPFFQKKISKASKKSSKFNFQYFLFQEEALKVLRHALNHPSIYPNIILTGADGTGKRTGILELLKTEYGKISPFPKYYYSPEDNHISIQKSENSIQLFGKETNQTPVVYELNPNFTNVFGGFQNGKFLPGHLIQSSGGFLIIPINRLLDQAFYDFLKNSLFLQKIDFKSLPENYFLKDFPRNFPPIPIYTRVILLGDEHSFERLLKIDNGLGDVFKIKVDLEYEADLNLENFHKFEGFIEYLARKMKIKIHRSGVQRLLEEALVFNENKKKFSLVVSDIKAIFEESVILAKEKKKKEIREEEIELALKEIHKRFSGPKKRYFDALKHNIYKIQLTGKRVGRINGMSIFTPYVSYQEFGQISTISARVIMGSGNLINIEREVNLSGDIHDRGIFVLQSYLKGLFHKFQGFGMDVSILFEQNHSIIDGDSATVAEFLAVLSAMSDVPIPANLAITGSMTQYGESLPIGAVIQKLESYFEISKLIGSSKEIYEAFIPEQNVRDLILSRELRKYIQKGKFRLIAYSHVEEVVEHIFRMPFGKLEKDGKYTPGSLLRIIEDKLEKR
jgi:predicted ATP-dependent protease